jgi:uncharacterized protein
VTLIDAGPLIALIDAGEPQHEQCVDALGTLALPLLTTWPTFTEAIYLLGRSSGWPGQAALWQMLQRKALVLVPLDDDIVTRTAKLMEQYKDHPMDLADATLVAVAEARNIHTIFSLDQHFRSYQLRGPRHLDLVPR